ncbi:hypothetical protein THAOC_34445, partial [Thalassiosira oceanica]
MPSSSRSAEQRNDSYITHDVEYPQQDTPSEVFPAHPSQDVLPFVQVLRHLGGGRIPEVVTLIPVEDLHLGEEELRVDAAPVLGTVNRPAVEVGDDPDRLADAERSFVRVGPFEIAKKANNSRFPFLDRQRMNLGNSPKKKGCIGLPQNRLSISAASPATSLRKEPLITVHGAPARSRSAT